MSGRVRDKFGDSLDQVGWFCFNTVGRGSIGVRMHLLWQVSDVRGGGEWVGI